MISNLFNEFLRSWEIEKDAIHKVMDENKIFNEKYRVEYNLSTKDKEYKKNKKSIQVSKNKIASLILNDIPSNIFGKASLLETEYKIQGSVGKGNISEIPWICIFDKEITESAESGFYIVYLLKADMSGFYLSLNQGWTQYERNFKPKSIAMAEIEKSALKLKKKLKTISGFSFDPIDLKGSSSLAKGYELGNICSLYYDSNNLPNSSALINDLQKLIGTYRELKAIVGIDILDIDLVLDEEEFQVRSQTGKLRVLKPGKIAKKKKTIGSSSSSWRRDPDMAFLALSNANFLCEENSTHKTFISPITSEQFVEAHHLIPMEFQVDFDPSIDIPENIISLCPNCHRAFHNSTNELKSKLIKKFYSIRKDSLIKREIFIRQEKLLGYYKT